MDHQTKETALVIQNWNMMPYKFTGIIKINEAEYYYKSYYWLANGEFHREDGPAIIWSGGGGGKYWYLNGNKYLSQEEWFDALTSEQKEKAIWNMDQW